MTAISDSTTIEELAALVSEALSRAGITAVLSAAAQPRRTKGAANSRISL